MKTIHQLIILSTAIFFICSLPTTIVAQINSEIEEPQENTTLPEYPGGQEALLLFISRNIEYPLEAIEQEIQGRVIVKFIVNKYGYAESPSVVKSVNPLLDNAAIAVITKLERFTPATKNGENVEVFYHLPITFKLSEPNKKKK